MEGVEDEEERSFTLEGVWQCTQNIPGAILIENSITEQREWIPQSQVHDNSEVFDKGHIGEVVVSLWLARERGWWDE